MVDDAFLPSVNVLVRFLRSSPSWRLDTVPGYRTPVFRKLDDAPPSFDWTGSGFDRRFRFDYLPPGRRLLSSARSRFIDRSPLHALVRRATSSRGRAF